MKIVAVVESTDDANKNIFVSWKRENGCKSGCGFCKSSQDCKPFVTGPFCNPQNIKIQKGDEVEAELYGSSHIVPSLVIFFLPLIIFFAGYALYRHAIFAFFLVGVFVMVVGYVALLIKINRLWKNKVKGEIILVK